MFCPSTFRCVKVKAWWINEGRKNSKQNDCVTFKTYYIQFSMLYFNPEAERIILQSSSYQISSHFNNFMVLGSGHTCILIGKLSWVFIIYSYRSYTVYSIYYYFLLFFFFFFIFVAFTFPYFCGLAVIFPCNFPLVDFQCHW